MIPDLKRLKIITFWFFDVLRTYYSPLYSMSLMFVISLCRGKRRVSCIVLVLLWIVEDQILVSEGHGVLSGWMFLRGPDSFDGSFTLVSCAYVLFHISSVIEGGCPGGTSLQLSLFLQPHQSRWLTWHILSSQAFSLLRWTGKINMDLLVAGLQGIKSSWLYQYDTLVDRKDKDIRSVAPSTAFFQIYEHRFRFCVLT